VSSRVTTCSVHLERPVLLHFSEVNLGYDLRCYKSECNLELIALYHCQDMANEQLSITLLKRQARAVTAPVTGVGWNDKGKKTLAHPDYHLIHSMWHPTLNLGKVPADFTHRSGQWVWLQCPGCMHECGRHHEWEASVHLLTRHGGHIVCPYCESKGTKFCPCRSVENDPQLWREWHPSNPPANQVAKSSNEKYLWVCPEGHLPYKAICRDRCSYNTGCPVCGVEKSRTTRHPVVSIGRPDLAEEWDGRRNSKSPSEVTLGSHYKAWWVCSRNPEHPSWQALVKRRALSGNGCPACQAINRFKPRQFGPAGNLDAFDR